MNLKKIDKFMGVNLATYYLIYLFTFLLTFNTSKKIISSFKQPQLAAFWAEQLAWDAGPLSLRSWTKSVSLNLE